MSEYQGRSPQVEIKLRTVWVPVGAFAFFLIQQVSSSGVWTSLSLVFSGIWLASYLWSKSLSAGLRIVRRQKFGWNQVGDVFEEIILLENRALLPALWLVIVDQTTLTGHSISLGTGIGSSSSRRWVKRTVCTKRGEYQLGPTRIETGDIFGVYKVTIHYPDSASFVVAPPVISLPLDIQISIGQTLHDNRFSNKRTEVSTVSVRTREYVPGDSLKRIHWLISAKKDEPHVRLYENIHASKSCWVILDLDEGVHSIGGENDSVEQAIVVAISLAHKFLKEGLAVGLLAQGTEFVLLPPGKGPGQLRQIQRLLATCQPGSQPLKQLLLRAWHYLGDDSNILVVTPSLEQDWIAHLRQNRRKRVRPTLVLLKANHHRLDEVERFSQLANRYGIQNYLIHPEVFTTPEMRPGKRGVITWRFTPLGRAIKVMEDAPADRGGK